MSVPCGGSRQDRRPRAVRDHLSDFVDRAEREHERTVITRNGQPAAVVIGYEDLEAMEETLELLGTPGALERIQASEAAVESGDVVEGVDAVRALRQRS